MLESWLHDLLITLTSYRVLIKIELVSHEQGLEKFLAVIIPCPPWCRTNFFFLALLSLLFSTPSELQWARQFILSNLSLTSASPFLQGSLLWWIETPLPEPRLLNQCGTDTKTRHCPSKIRLCRHSEVGMLYLGVWKAISSHLVCPSSLLYGGLYCFSLPKFFPLLVYLGDCEFRVCPQESWLFPWLRSD